MRLSDVPDPDGDGAPDDADNCTLVFNPLQQDTDLDGNGNICDGDFDNNGIVNLTDLALMRVSFFDADPGIDLDMDSSGTVNFVDLAALKNTYFLTPGQSACPAPVLFRVSSRKKLMPGVKSAHYAP